MRTESIYDTCDIVSHNHFKICSIMKKASRNYPEYVCNGTNL